MTTASAPALTELTGTYTLDPAHTRIGFVARHAMVTKVRGAFNEFTGTAVLDSANPANSRVEVTIEAASIDTRNAQRDEHLRSNDFLAMQEYPKITFTSTREFAGFVPSSTAVPVNSLNAPRTLVTMACRATKPIRVCAGSRV